MAVFKQILNQRCRTTFSMLRMRYSILFAAGFLGLLWGGTSESFGQVPRHQDRIRDTARKILSRPEFRLFPRLKPGQPASRFSHGRASEGVPRLKSSRGLPPEAGEGVPQKRAGGQDQAENRAENGNGPRPRNPQELPGEAGGPKAKRPQNFEEALGREDLFPEAGNVDGLVENQELDAERIRQLRQNRLNRKNQPGDNNPPPENAENEPVLKQNPAKQAAGENPPPPKENPAAIRGADAEHPRKQAGNNALPAPCPREHTEEEQESSFRVPKPEVGEFARFVGALFHFTAWAILAVICGLILWLIVKAIREYERPLALAAGTAGEFAALDLEPAQAPGDLPADVYLAQAERLAEQGRYREAVVQLLLGAMSRVERAGWVRFRQGMTVRDYLKGVAEHPAAYQGFRCIIRVFEPLTFGRREPTQEHFAQSLKGYEAGFGLN